MKQRDILALMDGIAPGIAASFAKAIAPVLARLEAAEKRVAELEKAPADIDLDEIISVSVEKALAARVPKEVAALELKIEGDELKKVVEEAVSAVGPTLEKLATDVGEVRDMVLGLPGPDGLVALVDKTVAEKVAALPAIPTAEEVAALVKTPSVEELAALVPKPPTAEEVAALVPSGKDASPEAVKAAIAEAVAALPAMPTAAEVAAMLPAPAPGKDADPEVTAALVASEVEKAVAALPLAPTAEQVAALVPAPKDLTVDDVRPMIEETVAREVRAEIGGASIADAIAKAVDALPPAAPGKDADPAVIKAMVDEAVAAIPRIVQDGKDATPEQIAAAVEKVLATWERPKDGASVTLEQLQPVVDQAVEKAVAARPVPKDGADGVGLAGALIDRDGELVITLTDGTAKTLGPVVGKDGDPGVGWDEATEEMADDGRTIIRRYVRGDQVKEFRHTFAVVLDRGVFKDGTEYVAGDGVTFGGSFWIAQTTTKEKPGTSDAFRLAVKKGRDGKDGRDLGPPAPTPTVKLK